MKKDSVLSLIRKLHQIECYDDENMKHLLSLAYEIKQVYDYVSMKSPQNSHSLQGASEQLVESEGYLETWVRHPKKATRRTQFNESKNDFISILNDYLEFGNKYNLWIDAL